MCDSIRKSADSRSHDRVTRLKIGFEVRKAKNDVSGPTTAIGCAYRHNARTIIGDLNGERSIAQRKEFDRLPVWQMPPVLARHDNFSGQTSGTEEE